MMDITATDLVTVRRDDLLAMESEIKGLKAYADRLAAGLPDGMLPKDVENLRAANAGLTQEVHDLTAQLDTALNLCHDANAEIAELRDVVAALEKCRADGLEYASRLGRIDNMLMIEKLGGTVEPQEEQPLEIKCGRCHVPFGRRVDDTPTFEVQANAQGVVRFRRTRRAFAPCCPECGAERALY